MPVTRTLPLTLMPMLLLSNTVLVSTTVWFTAPPGELEALMPVCTLWTVFRLTVAATPETEMPVVPGSSYTVLLVTIGRAPSRSMPVDA